MRIKRNEILIDSCINSDLEDSPFFYLRTGCKYELTDLPEDWITSSDIISFNPNDQVFCISVELISFLLDSDDPEYRIEVRFYMNMFDASEDFVKEKLGNMDIDKDTTVATILQAYTKLLRIEKLKSIQC